VSSSRKHAKWNRRLAVFWFGPGMLLSVLLSVAFGNIVSLIWVGLMSAYANGMMHYLESRQEQT
jgi:hypothetical protein